MQANGPKEGLAGRQWTDLGHHVELHGHRDDVEADDRRDHQVEVLGRDQLVDPQSHRGVVDVVGGFEHLCKEEINWLLEGAPLVTSVKGLDPAKAEEEEEEVFVMMMTGGGQERERGRKGRGGKKDFFFLFKPKAASVGLANPVSSLFGKTKRKPRYVGKKELQIRCTGGGGGGGRGLFLSRADHHPSSLAPRFVTFWQGTMIDHSL